MTGSTFTRRPDGRKLFTGSLRAPILGGRTIRHQAITHLDMPPMTMVFQVQDSAVLDQVRVGDKVRFAASRQDDSLVVKTVEVE